MSDCPPVSVRIAIISDTHDRLPAHAGDVLAARFRSLDALSGGDEQTSRAWLRNENVALGGVPVALIESLSGMIHVVGYLDARRARV